MTSTTARSASTASPARRAWRTVDIVVAAVLAVAFGVVFQAWSLLWNAVDPFATAFEPVTGVLVGVWVMAGVVGAMIIRKPGAALFVELVAATVSALLGSQWGASTIVYGLCQGLAVELVFLAFAYRRWGLPVALLGGAAAGATAGVLDIVYYYAGWAAEWKAAYLGFVVLSGVVLAGFLGWALVRALATTGVLTPFASGREQRAT